MLDALSCKLRQSIEDPILDAFWLDFLVLQFGGRFHPVAIPNQMLRACMAVDRAVELRLLGESRPLIVAGGGAAGATAALRAAERHGIETILYEKDVSFNLQAGCKTRWIDPTQYDWPAPHFRSATCPPWSPPDLPLTWEANRSHELARRWRNRLFELCPKLLVQEDSRVTDYRHVKASSGAWFLDVDVALTGSGGGKWSPPCGMLFLCPGPGREIVQAGTGAAGYHGFEFWQTDPLEEPKLGLPTHPSVLISGSGDGALQDFLRITTGARSAAMLLSTFFAGFEGDLARIGSVVGGLEDRAARALVWSASRHSDHPTLQALHDGYRNIVGDLNGELWGQIKRGILARFAKRELRSVQLLYPCDHFGMTYPLNHFLTLIVARAFVELGLVPPLLQGHGVLRVRDCDDSHPCFRAEDCHRRAHVVTIAPQARCSDAGDALGEDKVFDVVVLRHGVAGADSTLAGRTGARRQLLPYHLPH